MGSTVSTGEDNDDLVDNLVERDCITTGGVEHVFRAVDRGNYFTEECRDSAYKDTAWRSDNLHLSAPCIYSSVMENLSLQPGHSFLNIGSGTGYVSTMVGLIIESTGVNHGVELYQEVIDYAQERLAEFIASSPAVDQYDFCPPQFVCGNGLLIGPGQQYDRVYCGARCPLSELACLKQLLKVGGVLVVPVNDYLKRIERLGESEWDVQDKLSVSFAGLIEPNVSGHSGPLSMPPRVPASLQQLCRTAIRRLLRAQLLADQPPPAATARAQRRRRPTSGRAEEERRIRRFVLPLVGASVAEIRSSDGEGEEEGEERRTGRHRRDSGHSEEAFMEPTGASEDDSDDEEQERDGQLQQERQDRRQERLDRLQKRAAATANSQQNEGQETATPQQEQDAVPGNSQEQKESIPAASKESASSNSGQQTETETETGDQGASPAEAGDNTVSTPEASQSRASLKRFNDDSTAGTEGGPAAGAGPCETQKRGRCDHLDSGLGDSPPLPPRDHSEPENGVAASSDDDGDDDDGDDGDVSDRERPRRRPARFIYGHVPPMWRHSAQSRAEFANEISRFLVGYSDDDDRDEPELDGGEPHRGRCPMSSRRRARPSRHASVEASQRLADQMRERIVRLPLPLPLRQYVNLDRPL
ncbi:uncharacterized protein LOC122366001 [Amphibalanus amphitrite]|uniref:uncharacterized protein LOC122366001 n=1 Tax=Amphibalanus amphitrite TaxID=1232801 RepID=UPI001C901243|nr:uncharacterized protein LOC122366001 [Amphibalanus amphitrite]XP_043193666.1 uncharacterized protein LOC122366001 [Amphibalanus amphitrite]